MSYIGDFAEDSTIRIPLTTHAAAGGAVGPSSAFEAADFRIYKNGSDTQKLTTNGLTTASPFDAVTGLHALVIDTSDDTGDAGFWEAGSDYWVVLVPDETVDGQTVVAVVAVISIENRHVVSPTVVVSAASVAATAANDSGRLTLVRFTTFGVQITELGSLADRVELYFSIKRSTGQIDDKALIRISEGVGLERLDGAAADDAAGASLVVDDEDAGDITIMIEIDVTAALPPFDNAPYDIKIVRSNGRVDVLTSVDYPNNATTRARCLDPVTRAMT